jgi:hypothetical protein
MARNTTKEKLKFLGGAFTAVLDPRCLKKHLKKCQHLFYNSGKKEHKPSRETDSLNRSGISHLNVSRKSIEGPAWN